MPYVSIILLYHESLKLNYYSINRTRIASAVKSVITHLQTTTNPEDDELVISFIHKMKLINKQFTAEGQGLAFTTSIYTLNLLLSLRTKLDPSRQSMIKHPFILELKGLSEASEIENKIEIAQKLYDFQNNLLLPSLKIIQTNHELMALEPIVDSCILLKNKLSSVDKKGVLEKSRSTIVMLWNLKSCLTHPIYFTLTSYEKGKLGVLNTPEARELKAKKLDGFITEFLNLFESPAIDQQDKIAIYDALSVIREEFEEQGDIQITLILNKLKAKLGIPKAIHSSFPIELQSLTTADQINDKKTVTQKFYEFQKNILLPTLKNAKTRQDFLDLEPIINQCIELKNKLTSIDKQNALEELQATLLELWNVKMIQTSSLYPSLINYEKGQTKGLEEEEKQKSVAAKLDIFISAFIKISTHPAVSQEDKVAIHKSICSLYEEFIQYSNGNLIKPILINLSKALGLFFPKEKSTSARSVEFEKVLNKWNQPSLSSSLSSITLSEQKKPLLETEIRDLLFGQIRETISRLDIHSPRMKGEIQQIKSAIQKLKELSLFQGTDFSQMENLLAIIKDPSVLKISTEENRFVELLILKCGLPEKDLEDYSKLQSTSIQNGQSFLIKELKKNTNSLDSFLKSAIILEDTFQEKVIKERFDLFVRIHPLLDSNPSLYFTLVKLFEEVTRNMIVKQLAEKWTQMLTHFDEETGGEFSKLLDHYSYMNPTKELDSFIKLSQEKLFSSLDTQAIIHLSKSELSSYLQNIVDKIKDYPSSLFEENYLEIYSEQHLWLATNYQNIKDPFNQDDDIHENLGEGVCYNNALHRFSMLQEDPNLEEIKMGSNRKTRYLQSKITSYYAEAKKGIITYQAAYDEQTKISVEYKLLQYHKYPLVTPSNVDTQQYLVDEMQRYAEVGHAQFVLTLYGPDNHHAVNVQLDLNNHMFRIMDDSIGLLQYNSLGHFKQEVALYFKHFYPTCDNYVFRLFKTI
jgi:hypothetical protein